ncbi:unnamed protein product [Arabidopsis thaliana]|uniref:Uncharacterized protein n=2 Tax=Arabidopsis thaliana TaxID=3702 RepID=A0A5S9XH25_ARATH|nr:unnamed protein product [Arabidopsis thaliana]
MSSMETQKIKASFISLRSEKIWLFEKTDLRIKGRITVKTASSMEAKGLICGLPAKNVIPRLRQQPQQPQQQANNN